MLSLTWSLLGVSCLGPYQQVHIAFGPDAEFLEDRKSSRHPCFRLASPEALIELRQRIWDHFVRGGPGAPKEADEPGRENSGKYMLLVADRDGVCDIP